MVFVEEPLAPVLAEDDVHHLVDVLRLRPGEPVVACDGRGTWTQCHFEGDGARGRGGAAVLVVDGEPVVEERSTPPIAVAFAPVKGDRPEWVVQKLTELGVDRIVPIRTARSVVRWDGTRAARTEARLRRVAREAAAQCRRTWLPSVEATTSFEVLADLSDGAPLLARPGGGPPSLDHPFVAVGPEGGFDDEELDRFPGGVGLGPTVLRSETAAVVAGALLCALRAGLARPLR